MGIKIIRGKYIDHIISNKSPDPVYPLENWKKVAKSIIL